MQATRALRAATTALRHLEHYQVASPNLVKVRA